MEETKKNLDEIGMGIRQLSRSELYMALPYLDTALCALSLSPGKEVTLSLATDGETLHYSGAYLAERYLRSRQGTNRAYLHVVLHCMLRHIYKKHGKDARLWDLSCDAAVESILDHLDYPCLRQAAAPAKEKFYGQCRREMKVLTAEGIYRHLLRQRPEEYELARLERLFFVDDHGLWDPESREDQEKRKQQDEQWKNRAQRTQTGMETVLAGQSTGGEAVLEQVQVAARDDVDYRAFLRRFAAPREVMGVDGDAFDYIFYTYGLSLYGNMPLVEPPETREEKRIEDFVIAVDTSMSTSGELVRAFLSCTYAILRSTSTFTRKVNIRILQCDDQIRSDTTIHDLRQLKEYMDHFQLTGGSATDFRPVFEYVEQLRRRGELTGLRGMVYFTDGMGIYPQKRPVWETAFVLLEEPPLSVQMPPWAIRLVLPLPDLGRAVEAAAEEFPDEIDWDELPQL